MMMITQYGYDDDDDQKKIYCACTVLCQSY